MKSKTDKNKTAIVWKSAIALGLLVALEAVIMISPFAGYFYSFFRPFLDIYSQWEVTSWLDGFFLNHALVSTSSVLEWQREIGRFLFVAGICGFLISFVEVYARKILRRGVARFGLYTLVRHPQYLSLAVVGWGLLTIWPRFFLLVLYVTMLFIYFLLAAHEERRMAALYPETYPTYATGKGSFLPGSPGDWLYRRTFGRIPIRDLGFLGCYGSVLVLAVLGAFLARGHVQANAEMVLRPEVGIYGFSCWPQGQEKLMRVVDRVLSDETVRSKMDQSEGDAFFLHVLPADYGMTGMFYRLERPKRPPRKGSHFFRIITDFLLARPRIYKGSLMMGHPMDQLKVVVSRTYQPWREVVPFEEALRPGTKMAPIAVVMLDASKEDVPLEVVTPIPENAWGNLTMPIF